MPPYTIRTHGTGHAPHILENPDDPADMIAICSCGGTHNAEGYCDGTHREKARLACPCNYCKPLDQRIKKKK